MFALGPVESGFLLLCLAGIGAALVGRWARVLTLRESLVALALALLVPVVGSVVALVLLVARWSRRRRAVPLHSA